MYAISRAVRSTGVQVAIGAGAIVAVAALLHWLFAWEGVTREQYQRQITIYALRDFESDVATYKARHGFLRALHFPT